jgi:hypothetical protein
MTLSKEPRTELDRNCRQAVAIRQLIGDSMAAAGVEALPRWKQSVPASSVGIEFVTVMIAPTDSQRKTSVLFPAVSTGGDSTVIVLVLLQTLQRVDSSSVAQDGA